MLRFAVVLLVVCVAAAPGPMAPAPAPDLVKYSFVFSVCTLCNVTYQYYNIVINFVLLLFTRKWFATILMFEKLRFCVSLSGCIKVHVFKILRAVCEGIFSQGS